MRINPINDIYEESYDVMNIFNLRMQASCHEARGIKMAGKKSTKKCNVKVL